jgi:asparagine synthase (glutamine-hydrolysing)
VHFPQDYPALVSLVTQGQLAQEALLVNGQSGDFISGNHIPKALTENPGEPIAAAIECLLGKHFKHWGHISTNGNLAIIRNMLFTEIAKLLANEPIDSDVNSYGIYEASEFIDRQAKYVINGQRAYEYLGFDWDLPLWHDRYLDYWSKRGLSEKMNQTLYRNMLYRANWGDVWRKIPVNKKNIRPRWLIPVRFLLKLLYVKAGKEAWHRFEQRYIDYFMSPLCNYSVRSWFDVASDLRLPQSAIAPHIEDYLARHGIPLHNFEQLNTQEL